MATRNMMAVAQDTLSKQKKYFTLEEANGSLPYVKRVVSDLTACYRHVLEIRQDMDHPSADQSTNQLDKAYDQAMDRLSELVDELSLVGVELKDFEKGLLDFPSLQEGREVLLCWKLGEEKIVAWHEVDAGFQGRQDVSALATKPK